MLATMLLAALTIGICGCNGKWYPLSAYQKGGVEYMEQKYSEEFTYIEPCYTGSNFTISIVGIWVSCETFPDEKIYVGIRSEEHLEYRDNYMDYYFAPQTEDYIMGIAKDYFDILDFGLKISSSQATDTMDLTTTFEEYYSDKYFYVNCTMEIGVSDEETIRKFTDDLLGRGVHFSLDIDVPSLYKRYVAYYYRYNDEFIFETRDYSRKINKYEIEPVFYTIYDDIDPVVPLPYLEDFESGTFDYVLDITPYCKWKIIDDGGNKILTCFELKQDDITDKKPICSLAIGDSTWEHYIFSFDCKIPEGSRIMFTLFVDTNTDNSTPDFIERTNPWVLELDCEGVLLYQTVLDYGRHYIGEESGAYDGAGTIKTKPIDGFIVDEWNHVRLIPVGLEVQMEINGSSIGKVAELQEVMSGRVAISGRVGCMFDNIAVEEVELIFEK